ncbi:MAG: heavy metal-associated domain-containing protein [Prolixibacteraceae bacterium]
MTIETIKVEGMTCSHCEAAVTRSLLKLEGVDEVVASKDKSEVKIAGENIDLQEVEKAINSIGYRFKGRVS